jgi:uncharacterized protein
MWPVFLIAFVVFALAVAGMAIGVIVARKRIQGSCGGLANLRDEHGRSMCEACSHPSPDCTGNPDERTNRSEPEAHAPGSPEKKPAHTVATAKKGTGPFFG